MSPEATTRLLAERCQEMAATGWQAYVPSPEGDDPEDEPLDVIHLVDQASQYRGVILTIARGGPNIEINTRDAAIYGRWGSSETKAFLPPSANLWLTTYWETVYRNASG